MFIVQDERIFCLSFLPVRESINKRTENPRELKMWFALCMNVTTTMMGKPIIMTTQP